MNEANVRVLQATDGQWIVDTPGGDRYPYPNQGQAEAFANAFRVFFDESASPGAIRNALSSLAAHQLNVELARRLRLKLKEAVEAEESF